MMRRGATRGKSKGAREARRSRSLDSEPCGEGGLMLRCASMDAEAAARVWSVDGLVPVGEASVGRKAVKGRPARKLLDKVLEAAAPFQADKAADAVSAAEVAAGIDEGDKRAADVKPAAAENTAVEEPSRGRRMKMPQETVDWILSRKRLVLEQEDPDEYYNRMINDPDRPEVYTQEFLEDERHLMRSMAIQVERAGNRLERFQRWMRHELETKGFVEIDDIYLTQRIRYRENFKKLYDAMMRVPGFIYDYKEYVEKELGPEYMEKELGGEYVENELRGEDAIETI